MIVLATYTLYTIKNVVMKSTPTVVKTEPIKTNVQQRGNVQASMEIKGNSVLSSVCFENSTHSNSHCIPLDHHLRHLIIVLCQLGIILLLPPAYK